MWRDRSNLIVGEKDMSLNKNSTGISLLSKEKSKGNTKEDYVVACLLYTSDAADE